MNEDIQEFDEVDRTDIDCYFWSTGSLKAFHSRYGFEQFWKEQDELEHQQTLDEIRARRKMAH